MKKLTVETKTTILSTVHSLLDRPTSPEAVALYIHELLEDPKPEWFESETEASVQCVVGEELQKERARLGRIFRLATQMDLDTEVKDAFSAIAYEVENG